MSESQEIFEVRELATLSCKCEHCGTEIVFDMATDEKFGLPKRCSTCGEPLGAAAQALHEYRTFFRSVTTSGAAVRVHAKPKK